MALFLPRQFLPYLIKIGSPKFRRAVVNALPWGALQELTEIVDKLHNISKEIFDDKVTAIEKGDEFVTLQVGQGKDIMSVLRQSPVASFIFRSARANILLPVKANRSANEEDKLPEEEVFGQMKWVICFFSLWRHLITVSFAVASFLLRSRRLRAPSRGSCTC